VTKLNKNNTQKQEEKNTSSRAQLLWDLTAHSPYNYY